MDPTMDPRFTAGLDMIRRTGARDVEIRWAGGPEDEQVAGPLVWTVVVSYSDDRAEADSAVASPVEAVLRLCERLIDGGRCVHCGRMTSFVPDLNTAVLDQFSCVTAWDPELETFRRGCEADQR
jgi:hypothetical protein